MLGDWDYWVVWEVVLEYFEPSGEAVLVGFGVSWSWYSVGLHGFRHLVSTKLTLCKTVVEQESIKLKKQRRPELAMLPRCGYDEKSTIVICE